MADETLDRSATPSDPETAESDDDASRRRTIRRMTASCSACQASRTEVLAELARAEASLHDPELAADESDGAVV